MKLQELSPGPATQWPRVIIARQTRNTKDARAIPLRIELPWLLLFLALALTIVEGAFRKWLLNSESGNLNYLVYFSKDVVFAGIALLPRRTGQSAPITLFGKWLIAGTVLFGTGALISALQGINAVGALLTVRAVLVLPLLALFAITRLPPLSRRWLALFIILFTLGNCVLGIWQNRMPADHVLNRYAVSDAEITAVDSGVRATGTFSYITGLGVLSQVGLWAGLVLLSTESGTAWSAAGIISLVAAFGCGFASVSRGPIVTNIIILLLWLCLSHVARKKALRSAGAVLCAIALIFTTNLAPIFTNLSLGVWARHAAGQDSFGERAFGQLNQALEAAEQAPFGKGFGTEQIAGNYARTGVMSFTSFENQLPRCMMECGILGLAGFLTICVGALLALHTAAKQSSQQGWRAAILATQLLLATLFYTNVIFNHTASAFAWLLFAAMMASLPKPTAQSELNHSENRKIKHRFRRTRIASGCAHDGERLAPN